MTAAYSNAVLVAILPYVSDFTEKLNLPVARPITTNQVTWSHPSRYQGEIEAGLILANHDFFLVDPRGFVSVFRAPLNFFTEQDYTDGTKYLGADHMTTNDAVQLVRDALRKLGYKPELTHADQTPTVKGPYNPKRGEHIPYCRVTWTWADDVNMSSQNRINIDVNLDTKTLAGMELLFSRTNHLDTTRPQVSIVPELESDYKKRMSGKMFINSNAPPRFPHKSPDQE